MTGRPTTNASDAARAQFVRAREADHAELRASLGGERTWLGARRDEALAHFTQLGLPTRKLEDWRYTNVAPLAETTYTRNAEPAQHTVGASALPGVFEAVFVDGVFLPDASHLPDDGSVRFHTLEAARGTDSEAGELLDAHLASLSDEKRDAFSALNTAMLSDGAVVEIGSNASATRPLHLRFLSAAEGSIAHPRVLVVARAGSAATIIEEHASLHTGRTLSNAVTEIVLEANAALNYVLVESANAESFQISNVQARLARDARLRAHTLTLDGALTRNEIGVVLADTGAEVDLDALFLASGNGHVDNHTLVDHAMPHCQSRELYKGLISDSARGVFRGRVLVRPDAQKTNAFQSNPNLLLSDRAEVDTKPQLEIYADDVKCSHGSTIGQLDPEAVFYLRSRGISQEVAKNMLARGFANEVVDSLPGDALRAWMGGLIDARLDAVLAKEAT